MELTAREFWTLLHGMGFGTLYLMTCPVAIIELYRRYKPHSHQSIEAADEVFLARWLFAIAVLAWVSVLSGAYVVYPWYRAVPPALHQSLSAFPQALLNSTPATIGWHSIGMEWKEHVAWITPIAATMACAVFLEYRQRLRCLPGLRSAVLAFLMISFACAGIAGFFGAELNKHAPVEGGHAMQLLHGEAR